MQKLSIENKAIQKNEILKGFKALKYEKPWIQIYFNKILEGLN